MVVAISLSKWRLALRSISSYVQLAVDANLQPHYQHKLVIGHWRLLIVGRWRLLFISRWRLLVISHRLLAAWLLVIGCWRLLVIGCWKLLLFIIGTQSALCVSGNGPARERNNNNRNKNKKLETISK